MLLEQRELEKKSGGGRSSVGGIGGKTTKGKVEVAREDKCWGVKREKE